MWKSKSTPSSDATPAQRLEMEMLAAVKAANADILRGYALRFDAPLDHADPDDGQTLLIKAAIHEKGLEHRVSLCRILLEKGANPDGKAKNKNAQTPLMYAASMPAYNVPVLRLLLDYGADIDALSGQGHTAISVAAYLGHESNVRFLLREGADIAVKDGQGKTATDWARDKERHKIVSIIEKSEQTRFANIERRLRSLETSLGRSSSTTPATLSSGPYAIQAEKEGVDGEGGPGEAPANYSPIPTNISSIAQIPELILMEARIEELERRVAQLMTQDFTKAPNTSAELSGLFTGIVGLENVKKQLETFLRSVKMDVQRKKEGFKTKEDKSVHMVFMGNPGTGKTTVARVVVEGLKKIGILKPTAPFLELQREDLVASYMGQTGAKVKAHFDGAKGGVIFIDEAYRLWRGEGGGGGDTGGGDYGREALEAIMAQMTSQNNSIVFIFAGYPAEMQRFLDANPGLRRRIPYVFTFDDYRPIDLAEIFIRCAAKNGFKVAPELREALPDIFEHSFSKEQRSRANGGLSERLFSYAKQDLDQNLDEEATGEQLVTIGKENVEKAVEVMNELGAL
ncbi:P-loop containing nucleoside triphosphate hydrolase protein [Hyaloraphidium curvatum]|nr:P-loop containing nucleoside triphosphate hydrolase protein [Hyaloraphidium curvatum]